MVQRWEASECAKLFRALKKFEFLLVADGKSEDGILCEMKLQKSGTSNLTSEALESLARHLICKYGKSIYAFNAGGSYLFLSLLIFFKKTISI